MERSLSAVLFDERSDRGFDRRRQLRRDFGALDCATGRQCAFEGVAGGTTAAALNEMRFHLRTHLGRDVPFEVP